MFEPKKEFRAGGFIDRNSHRVDLETVLPLSMPFGLHIEPTNRCNLSCCFCPLHFEDFYDIVGGRRTLDWDLYVKIIDDVSKMGGKLQNLQLYGDGEPFMNKRLTDMIAHARHRDVARWITVTTNGFLIDEAVADKLLDAGLDYLRVSVYAVERTFLNEKSGSRVDPMRVRDNLRRLKAKRDARGLARPFIYAKMIDAPESRSQIPLFLDSFQGCADEINLENPIDWNGYEGRDLVGGLDPRHECDLTRLQGWHAVQGTHREKRVCTTPFVALNVKADGQVVICVVDWNKGTVVGDVTRESLGEIWNGERLRAFRRMHLENRRHENASCRNCKVLHNNPDNIDRLAETAAERLLGPAQA